MRKDLVFVILPISPIPEGLPITMHRLIGAQFLEHVHSHWDGITKYRGAKLGTRVINILIRGHLLEGNEIFRINVARLIEPVYMQRPQRQAIMARICRKIKSKSKIALAYAIHGILKRFLGAKIRTHIFPRVKNLFAGMVFEALPFLGLCVIH